MSGACVLPGRDLLERLRCLSTNRASGKIAFEWLKPPLFANNFVGVILVSRKMMNILLVLSNRHGYTAGITDVAVFILEPLIAIIDGLSISNGLAI